MTASSGGERFNQLAAQYLAISRKWRSQDREIVTKRVCRVQFPKRSL